MRPIMPNMVERGVAADGGADVPGRPPSSTASAADADPPASADRTAAATRAIASAALVALIALGLAWELRWAPTGRGTLALKVLPLLPALGGLLRYRLYTFRWLSLLVWIYFVEGIVRVSDAASFAEHACAIAEIVLTLIVFLACAAHVRWRLAQARIG